MKIFYSDTHTLHNPAFEIFEGGRKVDYYECPERMTRILTALQNNSWANIMPPKDHGVDPILDVHDQDYIHFIKTAYERWLQEEKPKDPAGFLPATFPPNRWRRKSDSLLGQAGYYQFDLSVPITAGTFQAAYDAAQSAISGAQAIASDERAVFALCRPPGHHAGKDFAGGYCYLNNAAIAANWLSAVNKVAMLDIDYHAGNGTQDIFYEREDVLTISIHADTGFEYPHYGGFVDESGAGQGTGFHHNYPLPAGTNDSVYLSTLELALDKIKEFKPQFLVLSAGMDLYGGDPLGTFNVSHQGISQIGEQIAALALPTLIVMEGGYNNDALGQNIITLLEAFV